MGWFTNLFSPRNEEPVKEETVVVEKKDTSSSSCLYYPWIKHVKVFPITDTESLYIVNMHHGLDITPDILVWTGGCNLLSYISPEDLSLIKGSAYPTSIDIKSQVIPIPYKYLHDNYDIEPPEKWEHVWEFRNKLDRKWYPTYRESFLSDVFRRVLYSELDLSWSSVENINFLIEEDRVDVKTLYERSILLKELNDKEGFYTTDANGPRYYRTYKAMNFIGPLPQNYVGRENEFFDDFKQVVQRRDSNIPVPYIEDLEDQFVVIRRERDEDRPDCTLLTLRNKKYLDSDDYDLVICPDEFLTKRGYLNALLQLYVQILFKTTVDEFIHVVDHEYYTEREERLLLEHSTNPSKCTPEVFSILGSQKKSARVKYVSKFQRRPRSKRKSNPVKKNDKVETSDE